MFICGASLCQLSWPWFSEGFSYPRLILGISGIWFLGFLTSKVDSFMMVGWQEGQWHYKWRHLPQTLHRCDREIQFVYFLIIWLVRSVFLIKSDIFLWIDWEDHMRWYLRYKYLLHQRYCYYCNWDVLHKSTKRWGAASVRETFTYCQCPNTVQFLYSGSWYSRNPDM